MPELPEITVFARDMQKDVVGRTIAGVEVVQPKCLNLPEEEFAAALKGARFESVTAHGKWLKAETTLGWLLLNLGMGGEILLTGRNRLPNKYRLIFDLADGAALVVNFWWLGHAHYVTDLAEHPMVSKLGPESRLVTGYYFGTYQPNGWDPSGGNSSLNRTIERFGLDARLTHGRLAFDCFAKFNDWGPYDYHRDFNLTFPIQLMGDLSYSLGTPRWFGFAQTRIGVRGAWRSLDVHSNRYDAENADGKPGSEWEIRTYVHVAL